MPSEIKIYPHGDGQLGPLFRSAGITMAMDGAGRLDPRIVRVPDSATIHLVSLDKGMQSGLPSVAMAFPLPDQRVAFIEFSLRAFLDAAESLKAAHGDPRRYPGETIRGMETL